MVFNRVYDITLIDTSYSTECSCYTKLTFTEVDESIATIAYVRTLYNTLVYSIIIYELYMREVVVLVKI